MLELKYLIKFLPLKFLSKYSCGGILDRNTLRISELALSFMLIKSCDLQLQEKMIVTKQKKALMYLFLTGIIFWIYTTMNGISILC